jgi:alpha-1,6-mannosyltransferase
MDQVLAYKLLMNAAQLVNLALVWWLLSILLPSRRARLTAFTVFAWNPLMLFDGPGNAHNDVLMVTLLLLGVVPLAKSLKNRNWLVGAFSVGMSALIKYTTCLVGLLYVVPWARRLPSWPARIAWLGATGALVVGVTLVLFWPWLEPRAMEPIMTAANGKVWQYSNSAPDIIALQIDNKLLHEPSLDPEAENHFYLYGDLYATPTTDDTRATWKLIMRLLFAVYLAWECFRLWRQATADDATVLRSVLAASVRVFSVLILLVLPWVLDWYWMWPLALATLLGWRSTLTKVVVAYSLVCLPVFYMHHYWSSNTPSSLVFAYVLPPLAIPVVAWLFDRLGSARRSRIKVGSLVPAPVAGAE